MTMGAIKTSVLIIPLLLFQLALFGQSKPFVSLPAQLNDSSFADWIGPGDSDYGVFYFRKAVELKEVPKSFIIHVSADNRYRLWVNEKLVIWGPAVGDMFNWNYETTDIAPYLKEGKNIIASQVWNMGSLRGARQISHKTAFILQGNSPAEQVANTNNSWKIIKDRGYHGIAINRRIAGGGYIAGGTDSVDGFKHPWGWNLLSYDDAAWQAARKLGKGNHQGLDTWVGTPWMLQARKIPLMEQKLETIPQLLDVKGFSYPLSAYKGSLQTQIPPNTQAEILLDNGVLTMGFPQLLVSGGRGSKIKIQYQEALFNEEGGKGNRDEWRGKVMKGYYDVFLPDGGNRLFEPLWIRVFRYVKITVSTGNEPLSINGFKNLYTAYPLEQKATFTSSKKDFEKIWDVSWRTAQLCALETYMDCPYYEQLQYIGDTRIQALISMYVGGDERLVKNALEQFYASMQPMGLTKSNHPAAGTQIIPPFSLLYISMLHDYHMLGKDSGFVKQYMPGVKFILDWFISRIDDSGMLGPLPYWNHIDGGTKFVNGSPPGISDGGSAHMSVLLAYTIDRAAEMLTYYGYACDAENLLPVSAKLKENTLKLCLNRDKGLLAETPDQQLYSRHTNSFAILAGMFDAQTEKAVARKIIDDGSLIQTSLYFDFYVFQALKKAGLGGEVTALMEKWQTFLDYGLTTFPEHGIESRSDCHAWSAHPMYDFLSIVCGVTSSSPGFKTVKIEPQLGELTKASGTIPHYMGEIAVSFTKDKKERLRYEVVLPHNLTGVLKYKNQSYPLSGGKNINTLN
ncbi:alpha-L-rhamnosidase [Flammeovirgaceae bacterium 311]|nr:alpha-L-rhamnosidase [Flammeovirgaceae bacterium 311]